MVRFYPGLSLPELLEMPLEELFQWEHWRKRLTASEAMMALTVQHGKPQETLNMLQAMQLGMKTEEYQEKKASAAAVASNLQAAIALAEARRRKK